MTSVIDSPRRFFAELSPITQRTASMMLDFPQPLGPTTAAMLLGKLTVVGSTKDLNPASLMHLSRIGLACSQGGQYQLATALGIAAQHATNLRVVARHHRVEQLRE